MAKWVRSLVQDDGLNYIKNNAVVMLLIKAYAAGDSYATVLGNALASVAMSSSDFALASVGSARRITSAAKAGATASASSGVGPDLHIAFTDGSGAVIWVTDEITDQVITSGNPVDFASVSYTSGQPT